MSVLNRRHHILLHGLSLAVGTLILSLGIITAQDLNDDINDAVLLVLGKALLHVLDGGAQHGAIGRAQVQYRQHLALGQFARQVGLAQPLQQPRDGLWRVRLRLVLLCQRAGLRVEVADDLFVESSC